MIGKTLLHYEIKDSIGKGGMGEVFRARDTKLGRDVALKVLPQELSGDPEREARFQREARALASLQHPNVASVYGFEEAEGVRFLVMELVAGADLAQRMKQGPIPVDDALAIARQIAAGLEAAHENGIVHRDLKPANIMETEDGEVKILDFGLAQAWYGDTGTDSGSSMLPTITAAMTQAGAILGTAAYMAPEQARGAKVDRRADIWAFGVILFEMLTGQRLFQGETMSDTLAAVLRAEPDWDALPVQEHPTLCRLIERCLERNPKQRLRDIGEARIFLEDGGSEQSSLSFSHLDLGADAAGTARSRPPLALLALVAVACLAAGALVGRQLLASTDTPRVLHTMVPPPERTEYDLRDSAPGPAALSPDGTMIVFGAFDEDGASRLYLRHLDRGESVALSGTGSAAYPFWSPDSRFIGFFDMENGKLRKVAVAGGPPVSLCPAENGKGGSWNRQGDIIFAPAANNEIFRVPDIGGEAVRITEIGSDHNSHRHPRFLPDGEHFIFTARVNAAGRPNDVYLASLDTTFTPRIIAQTQANADYVDGELLTVREGVLVATPFTPDQERVTESGAPLVEDILVLPGAAVASFSPSPTGMFVYQTGSSAMTTKQLYWIELDGGDQEALGDTGQLFHPVISPDGSQAVMEVRGASNEGTDLWLVDLTTGLRTRFTFAPGDEYRPVWSRDGQFIYYASKQDGGYRILQQPVEGQGGAAIVLEAAEEILPTSVSPGDRELLLNHDRDGRYVEMQRLDLSSNEAELTTLVAMDEANVGGGIYSPDGRWIAYHAESASGFDVFVMPAGGGARKWQVTSDGAVFPHWTPDGEHLWVSNFNGDLRVYEVDGSGDTFRVGSYRPSVTVTPPDATGCYYDLHPDGLRLLTSGNEATFSADISYLHLVTDWRRALVQ